MKLQILIPTLVERSEKFNSLCDKLNSQISENSLNDQIEIISICDSREMSIGEKRNSLLSKANADYLCFIDDDDDVSESYIKKIYEAMLTDSDCVGIIGIITFDGKNPKHFYHSIKYNSYFEKDGIYYRPPNHLNPIKSSIAKQFNFPTINHGEDTDWAMRICKSGLIKSESFIDDPIYYYKYIRNK